jgi:hypothetical protein
MHQCLWEETGMGIVWNRYVSSGIREIGYDRFTQTMAVVFSDKTRKYHAPVLYSLYAAIFHAHSSERLYRQVVAGKIPVVTAF